MKKTITLWTLCALMLASIQTAMAQNGNGLGGGVRAGINFADFTGSTGTGRVGLRVGAFADYSIKRFGFELGLFYSEQGSFGAAPETTVTGARVNYRLDYLYAQLLVKYQLFTGFRLYVGPQAGYLLNSEWSYPGVREPFNGVNKWDIGLTGGVGYTFKFGLDISAGYTHGVVDLFSTSRYSNTSLFSVSVGWHFLNKNRSHRPIVAK